MNVKAEVGMTYAAALRAFLCQDPDIIMVGEIRDLSTAEIAIAKGSYSGRHGNFKGCRFGKNSSGGYFISKGGLVVKRFPGDKLPKIIEKYPAISSGEKDCGRVLLEF